MPIRDDRRMPTSAQWIATLVCGVVLGGLVLSASRPRNQPKPPPELKVAARRSSGPAKPPQPPQLIRVNLTPTPQTKLRIGVRGPYVVRSLKSRRVLREDTQLAETEVTLKQNWQGIGGKSFPREPLEITPKPGALVVVNRHAYHGSIRLYPGKSERMTAVNVLPLEEYVSCVIDAEMPATFPRAAREAQAIVARTYALWQIGQADPAANYDVFATVRSQKYLGVEYPDAKGRRLAGESASSKEAAAATRGQVCRFQGKLFCTYYSAVCGGATTPGREVFIDAGKPLQSVSCTWCKDSDKYRWQTTLTSQELLTAIRKDEKSSPPASIKTIRQLAGPKAGVIARFEISDGTRTTTVSGMDLRQRLPAGKLLSPHFSLKLVNHEIQVAGQGFGHGAGFCQWGARGLANQGKSAVEIVRYYYPGATVTADDNVE